MKFSLDFFKSEKRKELEELQIKEAKLKIAVLEKESKQIDKIWQQPIQIEVRKPYLNLKLVNNVLTIILNDGNILSKPNATQEDFIKARIATDESELFLITSSSEGLQEKREHEAKIAAIAKTIEGIDILRGLQDFDVEGNTVYLRGTRRSIPQLLVDEFAQLATKYKDSQVILESTDEYLALKRFFLWCCLNPRSEVADKLYGFLVKNSFRITKQGFFVALRNVVTVEKDNELVKFVSNSYNKVKAVWKKRAVDYYVWQEDDGSYIFNKLDLSNSNGISKFHGNLEELYLDLPNMAQNRFTDAHTHSFDIRIGQVVSMPPEECSWSTADCAEKGLHFTSDHINYVGCGDTSVLTLINPMKVVGIGELKGRCYEYLPIMTVPSNESTTILHDLDFDTLELDEDFAIRELEGLAEKAKDGFAKEAKKYEFNIPTLSSRELSNIVASLDDMKASISTRVSEIV